VLVEPAGPSMWAVVARSAPTFGIEDSALQPRFDPLAEEGAADGGCMPTAA